MIKNSVDPTIIAEAALAAAPKITGI